MKAWVFEALYGIKSGDKVGVMVDGVERVATYRNVNGEAQLFTEIVSSTSNYWTVGIRESDNEDN